MFGSEKRVLLPVFAVFPSGYFSFQVVTYYYSFHVAISTPATPLSTIIGSRATPRHYHSTPRWSPLSPVTSFAIAFHRPFFAHHLHIAHHARAINNAHHYSPELNMAISFRLPCKMPARSSLLSPTHAINYSIHAYPGFIHHARHHSAIRR